LICLFVRELNAVEEVWNFSLALAGFPFVRRGIRRKFLTLIDQTGCYEVNADIHLLCIHQAVDGATVGPVGYMFRNAPDVIDTSQIPAKFSAVLAGHIHRCQVLSRDLKSQILPAPIYYAGSIDRTSFAEKAERKGYLILEFDLDSSKGAVSDQWRFHQLPARPMIQLDLCASNMHNAELRAWIKTRIWALPEDSIVKIKIHDTVSSQAMEVLSAPALRALTPATMNVDAVLTEVRRSQRFQTRRSSSTRNAEL
jgi:DNA repair exonuclease SbcCD nuclease subunit